jgi:hypothetical protein
MDLAVGQLLWPVEGSLSYAGGSAKVFIGILNY